MLGNRIWASFTFLSLIILTLNSQTTRDYSDARGNVKVAIVNSQHEIGYMKISDEFWLRLRGQL